MSESRRKRYRKIKTEEKRPLIIAKREPDRDRLPPKQTEEQLIQPKILQKVKDPSDSVPSSSVLNSAPQKTIIITKDSITVEGGATTSISVSNLPNQSTPQSPSNAFQTKDTAADVPILEPTPIMTRPATVISSTSQINYNASKFLKKNNKDFLVVGIVGSQGIGKSTIMNLLAVDELNSETYTTIFKEQESIFPIKIKPNKGAAWPRTESIHMYITKDRTILLDSPPVLCNSYKKEEITTEMDDLHNIIILMSVCHLVILVQGDYFDMNLMRLIQMAELTKPNQDTKPFVEDYYPNVLFVKNRAKRIDYLDREKEELDKMLRFCFRESKLKIFLGETDEQKKSSNAPSSEKVVNCVCIPNVTDCASSSYHPDLQSIGTDFRRRVLMNPRNQLYKASGELTEAIWFEMLMRTATDWNHFFFRTYKEARISHYQNGTTGESDKFTPQ